jgi:hypothetical protein
VSVDRTRFRTYLEIAAGIATVLAVTVPGGIFLADHFGHRAAPTGGVLGAGRSPSSTAAPAGQSAVPSTVLPTVFLDSLTPDTGGTNFVAPPKALADQYAAAHPQAIACGSNNAGDQSRSVTYLLHGRYLRLTVGLHPYRKQADESRVQFQVFADNRTPEGATLPVDTSQDLQVDLEGVAKMTITVVCESPDALGLLTDAQLTHV